MIDLPKFENNSTWLITGAAGFIGSALVEELLKVGQRVIGLDNFSTGMRQNLRSIKENVGVNWQDFRLIEGDIRDRSLCHAACENVDYVLHHAAIVSVSESLKDPSVCHDVNVTGFANVIEAARQNNVKEFVYASSCAVYGDSGRQQQKEDDPLLPVSPYGTSKLINEQIAEGYARAFGFSSVGLRYFNIYGSHQRPDGPYAAVIPQWVSAMTEGRPTTIYGDGTTTRDFCHISDCVRANLLAALSSANPGKAVVANIAGGEPCSLNELHRILQNLFRVAYSDNPLPPTHEDFRPGDIHYSAANLDRAQKIIHFEPTIRIEEGLTEMSSTYQKNSSVKNGS